MESTPVSGVATKKDEPAGLLISIFVWGFGEDHARPKKLQLVEQCCCYYTMLLILVLVLPGRIVVLGMLLSSSLPAISKDK